jgi:predicted NUDIX family NTP pyrophosphohydrolase
MAAAKLTAGVLVYRIQNNILQILLAHAGGPFWAKKDDGAWSIFKGEPDENEDLLTTAKREFEEETSQTLPADAQLISLGESKLSGGKVAHIWALEHDYDPATIVSNTFEMEWPRGSGNLLEFPENDRAAWFDASESEKKFFKGQFVFVERLIEIVKAQNPNLKLASENT